MKVISSGKNAGVSTSFLVLAVFATLYTSVLCDDDGIHVDDSDIVPHMLVEMQQKFSKMIDSGSEEVMATIPAYVHANKGAAEVNSNGSIAVTTVTINVSSDWSIGVHHFTKVKFVFTVKDSNAHPSVQYCKPNDYNFCYPLNMMLRRMITHNSVSYYQYEVELIKEFSAYPLTPDLKFSVVSSGPLVLLTINEDITCPLVFVYSKAMPAYPPTFQIAPNVANRRRRRSLANWDGDVDSNRASKLNLRKRSTGCARSGYTVTFSDVGITNVYQPTSVNIYQCTGECSSSPLVYENGVKHTELVKINTAAITTITHPPVKCTPKSYLPLSILYTNSSLITHQDMVVNECGCL